MTLGLKFCEAGGVVKGATHPAAPESPEDTKTEMPSAAAKLNKLSKKLTEDWFPISHPEKLIVMI